MKRAVIFCVLLLSLVVLPQQSFAVENPLAVPNNKMGIHILFPSELQSAAKLINSSGGDWGYVTIPIQEGDKDLKKWQLFMDTARHLHIIPIIRLATAGDYFNTTSWSKPSESDVLDFANFLSSLTWPTKNRYIIVYNEVNRGDEWGGIPDPTAYADILSYAVTAFKSKNPDFFIISAGMDNAAANTSSSMNEYTFFQQMNQVVPGIFNQIDGFASHSYPNPAFAQPPSVHTGESITSFSYEKSFISTFTSKNLPVFITETGWSRNTISDTTAASYLQTALTTVWNDSSIVAITPFLLDAGSGAFTPFSFLNSSGNPTAVYDDFAQFPKIKGKPMLTPLVLAATTAQPTLPVKDFSGEKMPTLIVAVSHQTKQVIKWFLHW